MGSLKKPIPKILLFLGMVLLAVLYIPGIKKGGLPVYNPTDFNPKLVDNRLLGISNGHKVAGFTLKNQNGETITEANYKNKIYVADFFFTRCPSICPIMANNMKRLQNVFRENTDVMLLSLSVTPEMDSVPVLHDYAIKNGAMDAKWNITTGDKKHIYDLARKSYFAVVDENDGGLQDFIHTPNFILVDKEQQIRGIYDGTKEEDVNRLIQDISILQR